LLYRSLYPKTLRLLKPQAYANGYVHNGEFSWYYCCTPKAYYPNGYETLTSWFPVGCHCLTVRNLGQSIALRTKWLSVHMSKQRTVILNDISSTHLSLNETSPIKSSRFKWFQYSLKDSNTSTGQFDDW